jgi:Mrp family chromosome partitioning ATPase
MKSVIISADYAEDIEQSSTEEIAPQGSAQLSPLPVRDDEMQNLFRALQMMMPQKTHWTLGITSTLPGEGVSTVARGLARVVARTPGARVLICDVPSEQSSHGRNNGRNNARNSARDTRSATRASVGDSGGRIEFSWLPGSQIAVGALGDGGRNMSAITTDDSVRSIVSTASAGFEMVILDLPPVSESVIGPSFAKAVDGVLLVVEAERTRAHSVRATQKTLNMYGANVLGIVLNKRRFHIPNFIYRHL